MKFSKTLWPFFLESFSKIWYNTPQSGATIPDGIINIVIPAKLVLAKAGSGDPVNQLTNIPVNQQMKKMQNEPNLCPF